MARFSRVVAVPVSLAVLIIIALAAYLWVEGGGSEAQLVDFESLTPPEQDQVRAQWADDLEPQLSAPQGQVLHVTTVVTDASLGETLTHDAYLEVSADRKVEASVITTHGEDGRVIGVQRTVGAQTVTPDGSTIVMEDENALAEALPAASPAFLQGPMRLEPVDSAQADTALAFARSFDTPDGGRFRTEVVIDAESQVILASRLFELSGDDKDLIDSREITFEWVSRDQVPVELPAGE